MHFLHTFSLHSYLDTLVSYALALLLGALIGAERQYRQRTAGLRTNAVRVRRRPLVLTVEVASAGYAA